MIFHPTQKLVAKSNARFKVLCCGRGWGKTEFAVEVAIHEAISKGNQRVLYIAPTIQQARDIAWSRFKKRAEPITAKAKEAPSLELTVSSMDAENNNHVTSQIVLRGWESVETLRGQEFDYIVIDEVAMMRNFWEGWQEVLLPTLRMSRGDVLFISTPKGFNHFYELFNTKNENWESFQFTSYDNPHLSKEEIEEAKLNSTDDKFAQEYLADFRKQSGLIYKEFVRERHLFNDADIQHAEVIAGLDFGWNTTALLTIKVDGSGTYWVTDEWYKSERTEEQVGEYVASQPFNKVYPDPASPSAIKVLTDKGVNCMDVNKKKDSVKSGILLVKDLFKQGRIRIHSSCTSLIWELEMYLWDDKKEETPVKENDHAVDALRYALMTHIPQSGRRDPSEAYRVSQRRRAVGKTRAE